MEVRRLIRVLHHQPDAAERPGICELLRPANNTCLHNFPKSPLWIIEYVWAHKMMEIQDVVDPSNWPEVDSQPLSLEDSWRLRVASAQVYSIVKNRDMEHFDKVMGFLEATYRLLPGLVASIKHMKIMFGLKTLVIMRMLREGRGMVETVLKTTQFFPSKLPQYQGQCSQPEMFLMRKNHLDFKTLAQALAMNKEKLEYYIKNQMEEQYGEHYAQKVEDRLLHYLQELEAALPGDTYIDKILKKESPVTEEEKLLMEVITSDSSNIATTLKTLLHCDAASCRPGSTSQTTARGTESSPPQCRRSPEARLKSTQANTLRRFQSEVFRGAREANGEEDGEVVRRSEEDGSPGQEPSASPQFCSKHQRWVRSILQECPDECSEELPPQADVSSSPLLFLSSSPDAPSSEDLTPSDIVPCPPDQQRPPPQTSTHLLTAVQASEGDRMSGSAGSGMDESHTELLLSSRDTDVSTRLSPVVRRKDLASVIFKPCQVLLKRLPVSGNPPSAPEGVTSPPRHNTTPLGTRRDTGVHPADAVATTTAPSGTLKVQTALLSLAVRDGRVLLQPYVRVHRLSARECCRVPGLSAPPGRAEAALQASKDDVEQDRSGQEDKDADCSFDVNTLYSGDSSSDSDDSFHGDPEFKPRFKKKRLLSE
ncbi:tinf2 [Pungitius sinensis]